MNLVLTSSVAGEPEDVDEPIATPESARPLAGEFAAVLTDQLHAA